ncbi:MAG: hypothetical protein NTW03_07180 [Verrucomicrobia bacterium]|nr:hypothetical protein [Verrucomicrobiota bacterium]
MNDTPPDQLTFARFSEFLRTPFQVRLAPASTLELLLVEATALRPAIRGGTGGERFESFSIVFEGPEDPMLPQATYSLEHEQMGRFDLFMVPIGKENQSIRYQALFNRLVSAP